MTKQKILTAWFYAYLMGDWEKCAVYEKLLNEIGI